MFNFSAFYQSKMPTMFVGEPGHTVMEVNPHLMHLSTLFLFTLGVLTSTHTFSSFPHIQKNSGSVRADAKKTCPSKFIIAEFANNSEIT